MQMPLMPTDSLEDESSVILSDDPTENRTPVLLKTGLNVWSGTVSEEYLGDLRPWSKAVKVYKEMQDDAVIGSLLESVKTPLLASPFEVIAGGDSTNDIWNKDFLTANLLENEDLDWEQHVDDMLEFFDFGFAICEKSLQKKQDGYLYIRDLMPVGQETLYEWGPPDSKGWPINFTQLTRYGRIEKAPMHKLLHFTFRARKRNPQGQGILRSLYRPWFFKKNLETVEAIGAERDVGNAPVVELKEGINYPEASLQKLAQGLEGFRQDESVYLILPGGAKITAYGGGNKTYDIRQIIRDWQHVIRQRFFADFLGLGSEGVGTQALAGESMGFFSLAERSIQNRMLKVWNTQLIPWLFRWNNITAEKLPRLAWLEPGTQNLQSLSQAYETLVKAGIIDSEDETVRGRVYRQMDLPEPRPLTPEEKMMKREEELMAMNGGMNPNGPPNGEQEPPGEDNAAKTGAIREGGESPV